VEKQLGPKTDAFLAAIKRDWREAELAPVDRALCAYAEKVTRTPTELGAADVEALRAVGLEDRAIHDAVQVIAYFNYINRVADALGTDPEDFYPARTASDRSGATERPRS
jgi:uncharacterized peroxidase-related enzyme